MGDYTRSGLSAVLTLKPDGTIELSMAPVPIGEVVTAIGWTLHQAIKFHRSFGELIEKSKAMLNEQPADQ